MGMHASLERALVVAPLAVCAPSRAFDGSFFSWSFVPWLFAGSPCLPYISMLSRGRCCYPVGASKRQASISQTARTPSGYGNTAERSANLWQRIVRARCQHEIRATEDKIKLELFDKLGTGIIFMYIRTAQQRRLRRQQKQQQP